MEKAFLGIQGFENESPSVADGIPPRWVVNGAPGHWIQGNLFEWAGKAGFQKPGAVQRVALGKWFFRAWPEDGAGAGFFNSGIVVASAQPKKSNKEIGCHYCQACLGHPF